MLHFVQHDKRKWHDKRKRCYDNLKDNKQSYINHQFKNKSDEA